MSSSSSSLGREIDEYQGVSFGIGGSYESGKGSTSSSSSTSNAHYSSAVPSIPLEEFQEMQCRMASGVGTSLSRELSSPPQDEEEEEDVIYNCAPEVASTLDVLKLKVLVDRYQIPKEFNPRLPMEGEWCCCSLSSGLGVYTSYLLVGFRFPLNFFCRSLLHRLGIGPNQHNPNGWRTIVAMQVLWHEALQGDRPITVDEFLYCYKPSEIKKFASFYQF